jgi:ariadne-1
MDFYVKKNNHLEIFENNQRDLEIAVEKLCSHLEHGDHSTMDTSYIKQRVQDLTRYCNRRKQVLVDHVEYVIDKGNRWVFNEAGSE